MFNSMAKLDDFNEVVLRLLTNPIILVGFVFG
jgi:hypothetical protein